MGLYAVIHLITIDATDAQERGRAEATLSIEGVDSPLELSKLKVLEFLGGQSIQNYRLFGFLAERRPALKSPFDQSRALDEAFKAWANQPDGQQVQAFDPEGFGFLKDDGWMARHFDPDRFDGGVRFFTLRQLVEFDYSQPVVLDEKYRVSDPQRYEHDADFYAGRPYRDVLGEDYFQWLEQWKEFGAVLVVFGFV